MTLGFDLQANGWVDDGTESGALRVKPKDMVIIPFDTEPFSQSTGASLNAFYNGLSGREYGNGSVLTMSLNIGTGNYIRRVFTFRGAMLGICREISTSISNVPYTVVIDGVAYKAGKKSNKEVIPLQWDTQQPIQDNTFVEVIATDLPDTVHQGEIIIQGNASAVTTLKVFGISVSRSAGYREPVPAAWYLGKAALTTTLTALSSFAAIGVKSVSKFIFYNSTGSPVTVTVSYAGTNPLFVQSVPANSTIEWSFPIPFAIDKSLYQVSASADNAITMSVIGRV